MSCLHDPPPRLDTDHEVKSLEEFKQFHFHTKLFVVGLFDDGERINEGEKNDERPDISDDNLGTELEKRIDVQLFQPDSGAQEPIKLVNLPVKTSIRQLRHEAARKLPALIKSWRHVRLTPQGHTRSVSNAANLYDLGLRSNGAALTMTIDQDRHPLVDEAENEKDILGFTEASHHFENVLFAEFVRMGS